MVAVSGVEFVGPIMVLFSLFASRIFVPWVWSVRFVPVLSPLYRQQESWVGLQQAAVLMHVGSGMVAMLSIPFQFDSKLRRSDPQTHRRIGLLYITAGALCVASLNMLRSTSGAGSDPAHRSDTAMVLFIDACSICWVGSVAAALYCAAIQRDFERHRRLMTFSIGIMCVPIAQRISSFVVLAPLAMCARCVSVVVQWSDIPPWESRWGRPGSAYSLLFSSAVSSSSQDDPLASPYVLSLDGYGEGEQASFACSAWAGLLLQLTLVHKYTQMPAERVLNDAACADMFRLCLHRASALRDESAAVVCWQAVKACIWVAVGIGKLVALTMAYATVLVLASFVVLTVPIHVFNQVVRSNNSTAIALSSAAGSCFVGSVFVLYPLLELAGTFTNMLGLYTLVHKMSVSIRDLDSTTTDLESTDQQPMLAVEEGQLEDDDKVSI